MKATPALLVLFSATSALADDAAISYGGTPTALSGHPTVRMVRERVVIDIRRNGSIQYDCVFVFHNDGNACQVRMGFPDMAEAADGDAFSHKVQEAEEKGQSAPVFESLKHFRSFVNGKEVATKLLPVKNENASWHAKTVFFGKGKTVVVRDTYESEEGLFATGGGWASWCHYTMSTGASWKGPIGLADVIIRTPRQNIRLVSARKFKVENGLEFGGWKDLPKGSVLWSGFATPVSKGSEIRFSRRNFEPDKRSDIDLSYDYRPNDLAKKSR